MDGMAEAYLTPHAAARFRERIAPLGDAAILAIVRAGLHAPSSVTPKLCRDGTEAVTVRVRDLAVDGFPAPFSFRLVLYPPRVAGRPPVVGTVLHGTSGGSRGRGRPRRATPVLR